MYSGTDERTCPEHAELILPRLAGSSVFGPEVRRYREVAGISRPELSTKLNIGYSQLCAWERGVVLPPRTWQVAVEALDAALSARGKLVQVWLGAAPAQESLASKCYRLPHSSWPTRLQAQWEALVDYKTQNSGELPRKAKCRWSEATVQGIFGLTKAFMGYLLATQAVQREHLSLVLLCDKKLIKGFLTFKQERSGRTHFTHADEMFVRHYQSILRVYFPFLWKEVENDFYWKDRLPEMPQVAGALLRRSEMHILLKAASKAAAVLFRASLDLIPETGTDAAAKSHVLCQA